MTTPIEDYALISNSRTAALVALNGSIDWLCLPRFDSASTFGALLGELGNGNWSIRPVDPDAVPSRSYSGSTFTLVTRWTTSTGVVEVVDCMPMGVGSARTRVDVIRLVRGVSGTVEMRQELRIRFDYGRTLPWVRQSGEDESPELLAVAGPDALVVRGPRMKPEDHAHATEFAVHAGGEVPIQLTWFPSHEDVPEPIDVDKALSDTDDHWATWADACEHPGPHRETVVRSLLTLRAMTHEDTGGIVAAVTTSLPEQFGGERNWDYRYVWLRDASLTLEALLAHGYRSEAAAWREWLLRAVAGDPNDVQIMYGLAGERSIPERTIPELTGYDGAYPVRVGNAAVDQYQADAVGHVMVALHTARVEGVEDSSFSWPLQRALMSFVEANWERPDQGMWEIRGAARHFTHSRVMVWAAFDRAIAAVRDYGLDGPIKRWEHLRDSVRREIDAQGYDARLGSFVQYYGGTELDASLLLLPELGFCAADDPRMLGTVAAIEKDLIEDGLVIRYRSHDNADGLPPGENPFIACSFWLVRQYAQSGRLDEAKRLMDRLIGLTNDVGLLSEEVETSTGRLAGNFPQAFSHLALVRAADALGLAEDPVGSSS